MVALAAIPPVIDITKGVKLDFSTSIIQCPYIVVFSFSWVKYILLRDFPVFDRLLGCSTLTLIDVLSNGS